MEELFNQIKLGLRNNLYLLSLYAALTIPDICSALDSQGGATNRKKYAEWFDANVAVKYKNFLTGEDCYYFRCSFLHQGSTKHAKSSYNRIIFLEPNSNSGIKLHNNRINGALNIDIIIFCNDIIESAQKWISENKDKPMFQKNYSNLIQRHINGIPPYIVGIPVIG